MKRLIIIASAALAIAGTALQAQPYQHITTYPPPLLVYTPSIGSTSTEGFVVGNAQPAAAGAQQWSGNFHWFGQGWKTTTTAASEQVDFIAEVRPVQGSTAPTGNWVLSAQVNGAGYSPVLTVSNTGVVTPGSGGFAGTVSSVTGTANQIASSPTSGAVILTLPSSIVTPGSLATIGSLGYTTGAGAGGSVIQGSSRTTTVEVDKPTGAITMFTAAGSTTPATFTVTDSAVVATDTIVLNEKSGTNLYEFFVTAVGAGSFNITFFTTGGTASDTPVINFSVLKGSAN